MEIKQWLERPWHAGLSVTASGRRRSSAKIGRLAGTRPLWVGALLRLCFLKSTPVIGKHTVFVSGQRVCRKECGFSRRFLASPRHGAIQTAIPTAGRTKMQFADPVCLKLKFSERCL